VAQKDYKEILPGLYQLKVPIPNNPLGYVLPYLIEGEHGYVMVDSGWNAPEAYGALMSQLMMLDVSLKALKKVIYTHVHPDHYGLAGRLKGDCDAEMVLGAPERHFIETRYRHPGHLLDQMTAWLRRNGVPERTEPDLAQASMLVRPFVAVADPDSVLEGGETLQIGRYEFEVIWTPGHSPGHMCFFDRRRRIILTGDHVLPTISPNVSVHPEQPENPLGQYLASLSRIKNLEVDYVLPAHQYEFNDLKGRVEELERHHMERLEEMIRGMRDHACTAYEVAGFTTWNTGKFEDFTPWMQRAAMGETLSHLEYALHEGLVLKDETNGVVRYRAALSTAAGR
jgi:glyoxylase-like metal-dependent hydrolase (beta-lactamase superfamily II)